MLIWLGRIFSVSGSGGDNQNYYTRDEIDAIFASSYTVRQLNDKLTQLENTKADKTELPPIEDKIGDIETAVDAILAGGGAAKLQDKDVVIDSEDVVDVTPDSGFNGLSKVQVIPSTKEYNETITSNGTYNINTGKDLYNGGTITVDVSGGGGDDWTLDVSDVPNSTSSKPLFRTLKATNIPKNLIGWDKLVNGQYMFRECSGLTSFSVDLPSVTNSNYMFYSCTNLETFKGALPLITNGNAMFSGCQSLTAFDGSFPKLTNGYNMFYNCSKLKELNIDLPSLIEAEYMFERCTDLTTFKTNLSSLENSHTMFSDCSSLTTFDSDLSSLTQATHMFAGNCRALTTFKSNLSSLNTYNYDPYSASSAVYNMFGGCSSLANVELTGTLNAAINWSYTTVLTVDSMVNIMNALVDLNGQESKTTLFGSTNLAKLNDEQKAIATNKNWILS